MGLLAVLAAAGCARRPRAPALEDSAVYQNDRVGFRFAVPEGWSQQAKTDLPPGPVPKERALVIYRAFEPAPASLEVSVLDLGDEPTPEVYLSTRKVSGTRWKAIEKPRPVLLGGRAGTRHVLEATVRGQRTRREVVVFRLGERVLFFSALFPVGDRLRQAQVREALEGLRWQ